MQLDESRAGVVEKATHGVAVLADDLERRQSSVHVFLCGREDPMEIPALARHRTCGSGRGRRDASTFRRVNVTACGENAGLACGRSATHANRSSV